MGIGKFFFGCVLCVGGIGAAAAMEADGQDLNTMQRALDGSTSSHEGSGNGGSGGDALGISHENSAPSNSSSSSSNDNCPSAAPAPSARNRRANLGWQSLLPGSIQ